MAYSYGQAHIILYGGMFVDIEYVFQGGNEQDLQNQLLEIIAEKLIECYVAESNGRNSEVLAGECGRII